MIEINNLKASNDEKEILDIKKFFFYDDESYLISGINGSGKSSFIKLLANDIDESKYQHLKLGGEVLVDGENILNSLCGREKFNKSLCYVSQIDEFLTNTIGEEITVYYNISNDANISKKKIVELVESLQLENLLLKTFSGKNSLDDVMKLKIDTLSGGQKKIVHIVRELVKNINAKYILLDEPLNNLDIKNITAISNLINRISKNRVLILVSHCKIFPFIKNGVKLENGKFYKCEYDCLSCFGKANEEGYYE